MINNFLSQLLFGGSNGTADDTNAMHTNYVDRNTDIDWVIVDPYEQGKCGTMSVLLVTASIVT